MSSHILYKVKSVEEDELLLKARIVPHGNGDSMKFDLKSDCSTCPPLGIRTFFNNRRS